VFWAWGEELRVHQVGEQGAEWGQVVGVWSHQSGEQEAEWGQVVGVWSHQSGEQEAEWGQALGEGAQPPYVTGHEWLH